MHRSLAGVLAVVASVIFSGTAQAGTFVAAVYTDFNNDDAKGLVLVEHPRNPDTASKLTVALGGLLPGHRYRLLFSRDGCATPLADARRIARFWLEADADGAVFQILITGRYGRGISNARSTRLMEEEGIYYFCRPANPVEAAGMAEPDGAYARFKNGSRRGLTVNAGAGNDQVSLMLALNGLASSNAIASCTARSPAGNSRRVIRTNRSWSACSGPMAPAWLLSPAASRLTLPRK